MMGASGPSKDPTVWDRLVENSDQYKEDSRMFRRTVFDEDDWKKFRSSGRLLNNLFTLFSSGVIRGLWVEVGLVASVAMSVYIFNTLVLSGSLPTIFGYQFEDPVSLPAIPFTLSSPALALLLVFRTNTVYARWNEARTAWARIEVHLCNLGRQGCTYLEVEQEEEHMRRVIALAHTLRQHFQPCKDGSFEARICDLLGKKELDRLQKANDMPIHAISDITRVVRRSQTIDGSTKARFDLHLDEVTSALVICERLKKTPVPLVYTRHTGRFLGLWILTLPFALANELNSHFVMVPIATLVAVFFFGIEELGIQIEEPFSILPIDDVIETIDSRLCQMQCYTCHDEDEDRSLGVDMSPLFDEDAQTSRGR